MTRLYNYLYNNPFVYLPLGLIIATSYIIVHHEDYIVDGKLKDVDLLFHWWLYIVIWPLVLLVIVPFEILSEIIKDFIQSLKE